MIPLLLIVSLLGASPESGRDPRLLVAAAASTRPAMDVLAREFERREDCRVSVSYGASGILENQIENGAPFDLFFSADEGWVGRLAGRGLAAAGSTKVYAAGRLVLVASDAADPSVRKLADLARGRFRRLALPNPETAPYGAAAREALRNLGLWKAVADRLVYAENVRDALRYARTGDADFAFAALSEARDSGLRRIDVPDGSHRRLLQAACVVRASAHPELAGRFLSFVTGAEGRRQWDAHGLEAP